MHKKIHSEDISVVVQGAISLQFTQGVLESIRRHLPNAEIILSTWEGSNPEGLDYDILVENIDPGAEIMDDNTGQRHNLNRQIVSTLGGLKRVTRKYTLKLRTDIELTGNGFLKYFDKFSARNEKGRIFKKRIVNCSTYARKAECFCFHPSDWTFFGLSEDVLNLYDIPLSPEPETSRWFYTHPLTKYHDKGVFGFFRHKICAEQYIWTQCIKKHIDITFEHMFDFSQGNIKLSKLLMANNFIIIEPDTYGIKFLKAEIKHLGDQTIYSYNDWFFLYKKYCDTKHFKFFVAKERIKLLIDIPFFLKYPRKYIERARPSKEESKC